MNLCECECVFTFHLEFGGFRTSIQTRGPLIFFPCIQQSQPTTLEISSLQFGVLWGFVVFGWGMGCCFFFKMLSLKSVVSNCIRVRIFNTTCHECIFSHFECIYTSSSLVSSVFTRLLHSFRVYFCL